MSGGGDVVTLKKLAERWISGELAREYPDHVRVKKACSSDTDRTVFRRFGDVKMPDGSRFGDRSIAAITLDDCDHVMRHALPASSASATRRHAAQCVHTLLNYAVYPLRLITSSPLPRGWLPKIKKERAKGWVYPSEDLALMKCRDVPLARRVFFGVLIREGFRVSEAFSLSWNDVDLERGVVVLNENKTEDPRSWVIGQDVARALATWKKLRGATEQKLVFTSELVGDRFNLSRNLREGLRRSGVRRSEILEVNPARMLLRTHDLRGSFVTVALATGRTEAWVTDRTGHRSSQMLYRYKRAARTASELGAGWFTPLDEAVPELADAKPKEPTPAAPAMPVKEPTSQPRLDPKAALRALLELDDELLDALLELRRKTARVA